MIVFFLSFLFQGTCSFGVMLPLLWIWGVFYFTYIKFSKRIHESLKLRIERFEILMPDEK